MIAWFITIAIAFVIARFAVKIDIKHNDAFVIDMFDEGILIGIVVVVMLVPFLNILGALVLMIFVLGDTFSNLDGENTMKKIFFIREKKKKDKPLD